MKKNWEEKKLVDVCELITCGVAARPKYVDEGVPFLSAKNVKNGKIIWNGYNHISKQTHEELTKNNKPLLGDILYTRVGSYGEAAVIEDNVEFSVFVSLTLIKVNKSILNNHFLKHYLNTNIIKTLAKKSISGSGVGNLNVGTVREFPIPIPPLSEQQWIVTVLDETFSVIAKAKENAEKNLQNARELFASYLQSVFTNSCESWERKTLGEVLQKTENVNPSLQPNTDFTYIDISSVNNDLFTIETVSVLKGKEAPSRARKLIRENDVIFATVRPTLKRIAIIPKEYDKQVCSTGYFVLRGKELIENKLLYYYLQTDLFMTNMEKLQKGASYPAVTDGEVRGQMIAFPKSLCEQKHILAKLDGLSAETKKLEAIYKQKIANFEELKKSILQKAFNGELKGAQT
ncbi:MAG: restriction endonuclease subunit S [bacterium]